MGRRRLRGGAERLLGKHDGRPGRVFRRAYDALVQEFGPLTPLGCLEASRAAAAWVNLDAAMRTLAALRRKRTTGGRGRKPSARDVERLARRQGLADKTYSQAIDTLREMAARRKSVSLAERLSEGAAS